MARFAVYRNPVGPGCLMDLQADLLDGLNTRVVVPLLPPDLAPKPALRLNPVFEVDGVIHYCVANMPGAVARTSTFALNNATLPFAIKLANLGAEKAMAEDPHLANGLNVSGGKIRHQAVAEALDLPYEPA